MRNAGTNVLLHATSLALLLDDDVGGGLGVEEVGGGVAVEASVGDELLEAII